MTASARLFLNPEPVIIRDRGQASVCPVEIQVSGLPTGVPRYLEVKLLNFRHYRPDNVDIWLKSPSGKTVMLMSDAGGVVPVHETDIAFRNGSAGPPPDNDNEGQFIPSHTLVEYSPSNYVGTDPDEFQPTATRLEELFNSGDDLNGTWQLWIMDDLGDYQGASMGSIDSWRIKFYYNNNP